MTLLIGLLAGVIGSCILLGVNPFTSSIKKDVKGDKEYNDMLKREYNFIRKS